MDDGDILYLGCGYLGVYVKPTKQNTNRCAFILYKAYLYEVNLAYWNF